MENEKSYHDMKQFLLKIKSACFSMKEKINNKDVVFQGENGQRLKKSILYNLKDIQEYSKNINTDFELIFNHDSLINNKEDLEFGNYKNLLKNNEQSITIYNIFNRLLLSSNLNFIKKDISCNFIKQTNYKIKLPEVLLNTIFTNLIDNALEYSFNKSEITINYELDDYYLIIYIKNIGIEILDDDEDYIFKKGRRGLNIDKHKGNMGFGLYTAKNIAKIFNGNIELEDKIEINDGKFQNIFKVKIPIKYIE